jgi:protein SERAC1
VYSTSLADKTLKLSARCVPLVFLAHSLGGLVVKQALVNLSMQSLTEPEIQETFQSVYAMLFFGVPCKGLDGERLGLAAMAKGQSSEGFLSDLRHNSPMVDKLAQEFLEVFDSHPWVRIYSFHETVESVAAVIVSFLA